MNAEPSRLWFARAAIALSLLLLIFFLVEPPAGHTTTDPGGVQRTVIGRSVEGRPIVAIESGDFDATIRVLVVGCIHGDERAGVAIADRVARALPPRELDIWIVPVLNPDGVSTETRGNAHGIDLNRNFPWRWRPLHGVFDSGTRPLSEPESRAAARLVLRVRPRISIWFHQQMDVVDESGGSLAIERRFSRLVGLRLGRLPREPGSVVGWENHELPGSTAFVVELPAGSLGNPAVRRYARAVLAVGR